MLVETEAPVSFFCYPVRRSELAPEGCVAHYLAATEENGKEALAALAGEFGARPSEAASPVDSGTSEGPLIALSIGRSTATLLPENAKISEEAVSSGADIEQRLRYSAPQDVPLVSGGAIG